MQLLIIRHGRAGERDTFAAETGKPDEKRPLTKDGRRRMREIARGLRKIVPKLDALATSPLTRAKQTARIVARGYDMGKLSELPALAPGGSRRGALTWARKHAKRERGVVALVGHEPDLSQLVMWLTAGSPSGAFGFKKGGACLIEMSDDRPGRGRVLWFFTPKQLRERAVR